MAPLMDKCLTIHCKQNEGPERERCRDADEATSPESDQRPLDLARNVGRLYVRQEPVGLAGNPELAFGEAEPQEVVHEYGGLNRKRIAFPRLAVEVGMP